MSTSDHSLQRPELFRDPVDAAQFGVVEKPLTTWERAYGNGALRKTLLLAVLALIWEIYAQRLNNPLLVPTFSATAQAFVDGFASGDLLGRALYSVRILVVGYAAGLALAAHLVTLSFGCE